LNRRTKCLFVLPDLSGGGAERVTLDLVRNIDKDEFDVTLFLLRYSGEYLNNIPENINLKYGIDGKRSFYLNFFKIFKELLIAVKEVDIVVGALELKGHLFATLAARLCNKSVIGWVHKHLGYYLQSASFLKRIIYKNITKILYKNMDKIVTVSNDAKVAIQSLFPQFANKVSYIYNPVDFSKIRELANENLPEWFKSIESKPILLSVGRLEYQKGFDLLLKAFAKVKKEGLEGTLVILGEGSMRKYLEDMVSDLNLKDDVILPGFVNPYPIMANSDVFILSSRYEGLPTVLIEALGLDLPIISTDCPAGPREILEDGRYGILIEPEDVDAMARSIKSYLTKGYKFHIKNLQSKENRVERFEIKNVCSQWEKILNRVW
jgi:glycosyltransferase involved in cell wall biosynthesis